VLSSCAAGWPKPTPARISRTGAAAIIQGAAETYAVGPPMFVQLLSSALTAALGEERARELRARGADMNWDQALAYALTHTT
jgi:hypothetical protein